MPPALRLCARKTIKLDDLEEVKVLTRPPQVNLWKDHYRAERTCPAGPLPSAEAERPATVLFSGCRWEWHTPGCAAAPAEWAQDSQRSPGSRDDGARPRMDRGDRPLQATNASSTHLAGGQGLRAPPRPAACTSPERGACDRLGIRAGRGRLVGVPPATPVPRRGGRSESIENGRGRAGRPAEEGTTGLARPCAARGLPGPPEGPQPVSAAPRRPRSAGDCR
ncbi:collagen alpha-1(II) chain-like [Acanthaster planci]|uniref:Collagen alpha-1(II) chain-like n=1 Tax=Acanthaster planci TaxID=133434 RepID=A0A8B7ZNB8_ACAPL|nr:collagen alpha-1(II) chain-like [Acanthaster planci]